MSTDLTPAQKAGLLIRKNRLQCGVTQLHLAEHLGVSTNTVYRWESGRSMPAPHRIRTLIAYLKHHPKIQSFFSAWQEAP